MFKKRQLRFCNKKASPLDDNILRDFGKQLKFKFNYNFEQNEYKTLNKSNINDLSNSPHLVSFNITGHSFILFLTMIKGKKYCLFIEKKDNTNIKIYSLKFRFDSILYNGTIFEGILTLNNKHCWIYFITDIYCMSGNIINNLPFSKRLNLISEILKTKYKYDDFMNVCHIQIQSFFLYHHLEMIKKNSNKELVFHPEYDSIKYIHHIKKMKSKYDNIVKNKTVFEIRKTHTPDVYELWYLKNNKKVKNSIACISTMKTSKFVRKIFEDNKNDKTIHVLCRFQNSFNIKGWVPIELSLNTKPDEL